jgi:hypothetical protein
MKKTFFSLAVLFSLAANAQSDEKMNIVKTNVTAYAFKNFNIAYERAINKWFSVNVSYANMPEGKFTFQSALPSNIKNEFGDLEVGNSSFTLETRFYIGKGFGKGFYLAPYYRNTQFKTSNLTYELDLNNETVPVNISGKATGNSAGLMIGAQWFLGESKNWVLDWWIIGAHYGASKGDFNAKTSRTLNAIEQQELKKQLEDLDIPLVDYTVTVNSNGAAMKVDGPWAGLRTGLSFGYRF